MRGQGLCGGGNGGSIDFITLLRGLAAVFVVIFHLWLTYCYGDISAVFPYLKVSRPIEGLRMVDLRPIFDRAHFTLGSVGVATFFLITGFLANHGIDRATPAKYLWKRALRIYPTYIACFSITFFNIWLYTRMTGQAFPYGFSDWLAQVSLFREVFWIPSIDGASWTLEAQIKFYLLIALLATLRRNRSAKGIVLTSMVIAGTSMLFSINMPRIMGAGNVFLTRLGSNWLLACFCLSYMLLGIPFYQHHTGRWNAGKAFAATAIIYAMFVACALAFSENAVSNIVNYTYGLALFAVCYILSRSTGGGVFRFRPLLFISKISYPLYAVHGLNGYILMTWLYNRGVKLYLCLAAAIIASLAVACIVHRFVEEPIGRLIRRGSRPAARDA